MDMLESIRRICGDDCRHVRILERSDRAGDEIGFKIPTLDINNCPALATALELIVAAARNTDSDNDRDMVERFITLWLPLMFLRDVSNRSGGRSGNASTLNASRSRIGSVSKAGLRKQLQWLCKGQWEEALFHAVVHSDRIKNLIHPTSRDRGESRTSSRRTKLNNRKAVELGLNGHISQAASALTHDRPVERSCCSASRPCPLRRARENLDLESNGNTMPHPCALCQVKKLFPNVPDDHDITQNCALLQTPDDSLPKTLNPDLLLKIIKNTRPKPSFDYCGWKDSHFRIFLVNHASFGDTGLFWLLNRLYSRQLSDDRLLTAWITPIYKGQDNISIRPIAIGHAFRRLIAKCVLRMYSKRIAAHLLKVNQYAVSCPGGSDIIVKTVSLALDEHADDFIVVKTDAASAFQSVSRKTIFEEILQHRNIWHLHHLMCALYARPVDLLFQLDSGDMATDLRCETGSMQGCPAGTLAFALAQATVSRQVMEDTDLGIKDSIDSGDFIPLWFADDGYFIGKPVVVARALSKFQSTMNPSGIKFNESKFQFFIGSQNARIQQGLVQVFLQELARLNSPLFKRSSMVSDSVVVSHTGSDGSDRFYSAPLSSISAGGIVLGVPIGPDTNFIRNHIASLCEKVRNAAERMDGNFKKEEFSAQVGSTILGYSTCTKLTSVQRNVDPAILEQCGTEADKALIEAFIRVSRVYDAVGCPDYEFLNQADIRQIQAPPRNGGFNIRSVSKPAIAAYVGAYGDFLKILNEDEQCSILPAVWRNKFLHPDEALASGRRWAVLMKGGYDILTRLHGTLPDSPGNKRPKLPGEGDWRQVHTAASGHSTESGHSSGRMQSSFEFIRCEADAVELRCLIRSRCATDIQNQGFTRNGRSAEHQILVAQGTGLKHGRASVTALLGGVPGQVFSNTRFAVHSRDKLNFPQPLVEQLIARGVTTSSSGLSLIKTNNNNDIIWKDLAGDCIVCDSRIPGQHARTMAFHDRQVKIIAEYAKEAGFDVEIESCALANERGRLANEVLLAAQREWVRRVAQNPSEVGTAPVISTGNARGRMGHETQQGEEPQVPMANLSVSDIRRLNDDHSRLDLVMTKENLRIMADFSFVSLTAQSVRMGADVHQVTATNSSLRRILQEREKVKDRKYGRIADLTGHKLAALIQSSPGALGKQFLTFISVLAKEAKKRMESDIAYRPEMSKMMYIRRLAVNAALHRAKSLEANCALLARAHRFEWAYSDANNMRFRGSRCDDPEAPQYA